MNYWWNFFAEAAAFHDAVVRVSDDFGVREGGAHRARLQTGGRPLSDAYSGDASPKDNKFANVLLCIACFLPRTNSTLPNYFCRRSTARTSTQQPIMISRRWQTYSYRYVIVELCTGVSIPLCCHLGCVCFVLLMVSPHCEQEKTRGEPLLTCAWRSRSSSSSDC